MHRSIFGALLVVVAIWPAPAFELSDHVLEREIADRLRVSRSLGTRDIDVTVTEARAVLSGTVPTLLVAWEAEQLAGRVAGLIEVTNQLVVSSRGRSDSAIRRELGEVFRRSVRLSEDELTLDVEQGRVSLRGRVKNASTRLVARDSAAGVAGVLQVDDGLETPPADDETIQATLEKLLGPRSHHQLRASVHVTVQEGVVTLLGEALRLFDRSRAERIALGVNGVREIVNAIDVVRRSPSVDVVYP
ncbi:MAG: BON domain-containing protein [Acidobacteriota bacterium]|nr:MAG: BON domain-containing protein [Acidobacteriota bacterium]